MDRQDALLAAEDGRFYAISKFGTGLASLATIERLGPHVVSFGLPSAPALYLNLARHAFIRVRDVDPADLFDLQPLGMRWPEKQGPLFDFLEGCIAHVVFSALALEAFANESIPMDYTVDWKRGKSTTKLDRAGIERWVSLEDKLTHILPRALGVPSPTPGQLLLFNKVKELRDRLVHLKAADRRASGPDDPTVWGDLLRSHNVPFCDQIHKLMEPFLPSGGRRWHKQYPYQGRLVSSEG